MKKTIQKLLSVILVAAICVSTLCSSIIGVNAAADSKLYSIVGSEIAAGTKVITMEVTLTDPAGMTNGKFDLMLGKDVIDDANFGTKVNDKGETVPDYDNYLSTPNSFTLEDLVGTKTVTPTFTGEYKKTSTATVWGTSAPTGTSETKWETTGNTRGGTWSDVANTIAWSTDGVTDINGNSLAASDTTRWEKLESRSGATAAENVTYKWVNTSTKTRWTMEGEGEPVVTKERVGYFNSNIPAQTSTTRWVYVSSQGDGSFFNPIRYEYQEQKKYYAYQKQTKSVLEYEYQEYTKVYEDVITYGESKLDIDKNNMIANINTYELRDVEVPVYDANGNQTGTTTEKQKVLIDSHVESIGNKGTLLPNAYDNKSGLWNTKIEITGGTRLDGTAFNVNDFVNDGYSSLAGTTTHAIAGEEADGRKYV